MNTPMIHFEEVTKLYGSVIGVNDINLSLAPGSYGLLGPNGSGKTTLFNVITGVTEADHGTLAWGADRRSALASTRKGTATASGTSTAPAK